LPDQFLVSREAIQNSIDAISEKNTLWKIWIKIRIRPVREDIEIYISDDWIGNNSKGSNLKKKNQDKYIGKHWIWENNLRQVLDRYKRVSSKNWTRVVMRITNKDYLEKMLLRLSDEELKDLLS
jgi:hypothetical protein